MRYKGMELFQEEDFGIGRENLSQLALQALYENKTRFTTDYTESVKNDAKNYIDGSISDDDVKDEIAALYEAVEENVRDDAFRLGFREGARVFRALLQI